MNNETVCESCSKEPIGKINIGRVIGKLDSFFSSNDLDAAEAHLEYWEREARSLGDERSLLSILNEELGLFRRTGDKAKADLAVSEALAILGNLDVTALPTAATVIVNAATTMKAFGKASEAIPLYSEAEEIYRNAGKSADFDFAALLNNKAAALSELTRFDEAEECYNRAIDILKADGHHDGEIAVSLINLAHLYFDRDDNAYSEVEEALDLAWEYINSARQPHDANYAFILSKCAPSFRYFKRIDEADALEAVAEEIYGNSI